jgi:hypothetical protein
MMIVVAVMFCCRELQGWFVVVADWCVGVVGSDGCDCKLVMRVTALF